MSMQETLRAAVKTFDNTINSKDYKNTCQALEDAYGPLTVRFEILAEQFGICGLDNPIVLEEGEDNDMEENDKYSYVAASECHAWDDTK